MNHKARISYREFYDVPRMVILTHRGIKLLLDCKFDESLDEYPSAYRVYILPEGLDEMSLVSWNTLPQRATTYVGDIPIADITFDPSKRAEIDTDVIDSLLRQKLAP